MLQFESQESNRIYTAEQVEELLSRERMKTSEQVEELLSRERMKTSEQVEELLSRERMKWNNALRVDGIIPEEEEEEESIKFELNYDLAQCNSKTERALNTIALQNYTKQQKYKYYSDKTVKLITIVFANNSLLEGKAWKNRTAAKFKSGEVVVQRLASDAAKNSKDFNHGNELIAAFSTFAGLENNEQVLGDVLIMCNHPKRITDIIRVIETHSSLISTRGVLFKYNIFFDECDDSGCLTNMVKFVKNIYNKKLNHLIDEIQLITATPTPEMHKRLIDVTPDAEKLLNIKKILQTDEITVKDWRTILDQEYLPFEGPKDPVDYVKRLSQIEPTQEKPAIFTPGKIYFVPSHYYCSRHEEMADLKVFQDNGYWVLILNGNFKEFRSPLGEIIEVCPLLKETGETRDVLRDWRIKNPTAGLIITGQMVLVRGITFLTDGFNFDYMIISGYFAKDIHSLVQLVGRGQGKEKYVDNFKVIMPQELYNCIEKYIEDATKLIEEDPEFFDQDMLAKIGKVDEFQNIEKHDEPTIEKLAEWVKDNVKMKNGKNARIQLSVWKNKKYENGFIMHKFGESEEKVWTVEEALKQRGGITPYSRRIFPCYTDVNDVNTLIWYIFYRND